MADDQKLASWLERLNMARYATRAEDDDYAWTEVGQVCLEMEVALHPEVVDPPPEPDPEPLDEDWTLLVDGVPALAGQTKWLPGSTGMDIFVKRGTKVRVPHRGTGAFRQVAGGPMPIGEYLFTYDDGRALRFRHVAQPATGHLEQGDVACVVYDPSMDMLRWPAGWPVPPDGYQHLDISLGSSAQRLNPQGGAGGDVPAYQHIFSHGGLPNCQIVSRTPGPPEGSR